MLDTKKNEPQENRHAYPILDSISGDFNKYNKRMSELIDDAEIEAEMEAESTIRSKNSRLLIISAVGLLVLAVIYLNTQAPTTETVKAPDAQEAASMENLEEILAKQVPVLDGANPIPPVPSARKAEELKERSVALLEPASPPPAKTKSMSKPQKSSKKPVPKLQPKISPETRKPSTPKPKSKAKPTPVRTIVASTSGQEDKGHYIQLGAFSVKKNAETFAQKLKRQKFDSSILVKSTRETRYMVNGGTFSTRTTGESRSNAIKAQGFNSTLKQTEPKAFMVVLGEFKSKKDSDQFQDKLSLKGFISSVDKMTVVSNTYAVQVGGFKNVKQARETQSKLVALGYKNSFLR